MPFGLDIPRSMLDKSGHKLAARLFLVLPLLGLCRAAQERLHFVLNASEGGWPLSLFSGPFDPEETVYCHASMDRCRDGEGVGGAGNGDDPTDALWCDVQEKVNASHVRVDCTKDDDDEEEYDVRVMPMECCEREVDGDAPVHTTPAGLIHYATSSRNGPPNVIEGMRLLENTYKDELQKLEQKPVMTYFYSLYKECCDENGEEYLVDSNIPLRMSKAVRYQGRVYRSLNKTTTRNIDFKWNLAQLAEEKGLNVKGGPFPVTFFSCSQALEAVQDPGALFYVKLSYGTRGQGIEVVTRAELVEMNKGGDCESDPEDFIVQEGITDLALIGGRRFDIRFYVLVHGGRVYMHLNSFAKWTPGPTHDPSSTQQALDFVFRELNQRNRIYSFLSNNSTGVPKQWLDAIHEQLVAAVPTLEPVVIATSENDKLYHIFGGDAMIRKNGEAVIPEFNDWPMVRLKVGQLAYLDESGEEIGERNLTGAVAANRKTVSAVFADFFAIVLGIAKTDDGSTLLEGRVREVVAKSATCATRTY